MTDKTAPPEIPESENRKLELLKNVLFLILVMFTFLVALELMGKSFKLFGKDFSNSLFQATSQPIVALFIGMLATAIIQSSSTSTSMIVAMVAAGAGEPGADVELIIASTVPMIMGANIGTSVTSTIVSLGHITKRREYRKAIAAATVHDFFNLMAVMVLLPLEVFFHVLSKPATAFANTFFSAGEGEKVFNIMAYTTKPAAKLILSGIEKMGAADDILPWITLPVAVLLLFMSLRWLTVLLKRLLIGGVKDKLNKTIFGNPFKAMAWGTGLTTMVQSSSVTTSLLVPLVATGKVSLRKAFPFLMGANIGTTTTALIAAMVATGNSSAGLAVAVCHVLFNLFGVFIIYPIERVRMIPIYLARRLGRATLQNRLYGIIYVVVTFFLIPFVLILLTS